MRLKKGNVLVFSFGLVTVWLFIIVFTPTPDSTHKASYHRELLQEIKARHSSVTSPNNHVSKHKKVKMKPAGMTANEVKDDAISQIKENSDDLNKKVGESFDKNGKLARDTSKVKGKNVYNFIQKNSKKAGDSIEKKVEMGNLSFVSNKSESKVTYVQWEKNLVVSHKANTKASYIKLWDEAASWVKTDRITLPGAAELGSILHGMQSAKIKRADVGYKGTQLKAWFFLEGGQKVVFKPKWYARDEVMTGTPYSGKDRRNGEIASFHLNRILGFHRAPLVVGRIVNMAEEFLPVATAALNSTVMSQNGNICFYGVCHYCTPKDPICADGVIMEGSLTLWLPDKFTLRKWKHPWARTYKAGKKAKWEEDDNYCQGVKKNYPIEKKRLLLDIVDTAVFDYLIGNADRHLFETFEHDSDPMLLLLDNGKSFGNPYWDESSILAPVRQCCIIRNQTWTSLQSFQENSLSESMRQVLSHDPIAPVLNELHLRALDRRLQEIITVVNSCIKEKGQSVLL